MILNFFYTIKNDHEVVLHKLIFVKKKVRSNDKVEESTCVKIYEIKDTVSQNVELFFLF
jgi:hypothetical protein